MDKHADTGKASSKLPATFKVSRADRIVDTDSGATKIDLVRYYVLVSALMLQHSVG